MSKEYVEREALIEELKRRDFLPVIVKQAIEAVPAADVAPVRHGRWLTWEEQFPAHIPSRKSGLGVFCSTLYNMLVAGDVQIGACMLPDKKRPCLCIEEGNKVDVYAYFKSIDKAVEFMDRLADMVGAKMVGDTP